ncbi:MAG: hypothetical protein KDD06_21285 [Phaeodactylibacter sp.]|nr:hypothetical protein [Phaeodactylibacter sp.]MCB9265594.1 hypothetical protein [Lewinellaceae bacterium]MCB9290035.1 hypothetical protein [Lewinellaceae bacterium]
MSNCLHATAVMIIALFTTGCGGSGNPNAQGNSSWQEEFGLEKRTLATTGRNDYFVLEPGFQLVLESSTEKLMITVLEETKEVDGVTTRVVEEREWRNDELIEVSRNFFAIDEKTKDVFYFGEEVDMYKGGKVDSHTGAWLAGKDGARAGLIMPGKPKVGMRYYQEIARGVAMDRAEVLKLDDKLETPAGTFSGCLLTKEGSALNPFELEFKTYAPGIGLLQDEKLLLTRHGFTAED